MFDYTSALTQVFGYGADKTLDNTTDEAIRKSYYDNIIITISNKEKPHFLEKLFDKSTPRHTESRMSVMTDGIVFHEG